MLMMRSFSMPARGADDFWLERDRNDHALECSSDVVGVKAPCLEVQAVREHKCGLLLTLR